MDYKILYKFPSRSRPEKFFKAIDNISSLSFSNNYLIQATLDLDDESMNNAEVRAKLSMYSKVIPEWGYSKGKIDAVNRAMDFIPTWDISVLMSDDMVFVRSSFDEVIRDAFRKNFNDLDGLAHFPDGILADRLITLSIMGRKFYDRFGYIYYPGYWSVYADQEQHQVAMILGKHKYFPTDIVRHVHPAWNLAPLDELYRRNEEPTAYKKDGYLFLSRREINFGL